MGVLFYRCQTQDPLKYLKEINQYPIFDGKTIVVIPFETELSLNLYPMTPDYAHKIFTDKRTNYNLLMEVLAMDGI
jgi:hypothetical protein